MFRSSVYFRRVFKSRYYSRFGVIGVFTCTCVALRGDYVRSLLPYQGDRCRLIRFSKGAKGVTSRVLACRRRDVLLRHGPLALRVDHCGTQGLTVVRFLKFGSGSLLLGVDVELLPFVRDPVLVAWGRSNERL